MQVELYSACLEIDLERRELLRSPHGYDSRGRAAVQKGFQLLKCSQRIAIDRNDAIAGFKPSHICRRTKLNLADNQIFRIDDDA